MIDDIDPKCFHSSFYSMSVNKYGAARRCITLTFWYRKLD